MDRVQKEALVEQMREELVNASLVIVTRQSGLTVEEVTRLRRAMRENGAHFKVLKNTLAQLAVRGTRLEGLTEHLKGPTAVAYSKDPVQAAKILVKFASGNDKIEVVAGNLDGQLMNKASVAALATLPSLDELRGKLIAVITAPATKIARIMQEPAAQLARLAGAYGAKQ